ncbi:histone acetyltransferase p300 [Zeugodacus cucurbitae]|nr:histone acetyltransferase p300 [Zeugodacus cucurbitae]
MSDHKNGPPQKRTKMDPTIGNSNWMVYHGGGGGLARSGTGLGVNVVGESNISSTQAPVQGGPQMNGVSDDNTGVNQGGGGIIGARNYNSFSGGATISQGGYGSASNNAGTEERNWREMVTADQRKLLVNKFVLAIMPNPDPLTRADRRFSCLVDYAEKVERDYYEAAKSREEYHLLLAEKIYKINKNLEEKRMERQMQQQQQAGGGEPGQAGQNIVGIRGHYPGGTLLAKQQQLQRSQFPLQQQGNLFVGPPGPIPNCGMRVMPTSTSESIVVPSSDSSPYGPSPNSGMRVMPTSTSESIVVPSPDSSPNGPSPNSGMRVMPTFTSESIVVPCPDSTLYGIQVIPVSPIPGQQQQPITTYKCNIRY